MQKNALNAESIINSLNFSSYDESNICELKEGIPFEEFDVTVDELADLIGLPEKHKKTIKQAKTFKDANIQAVRKMNFKEKTVPWSLVE